MSFAHRINKGKQSGVFLAQLGNWNLRRTGDDQYKVAAIDPVNGKANYTFSVKDGAIDTTAVLDAYKMRDERPELYKTVVEHFKTLIVATEPAITIEADPYGDLAISRNRQLTPEQNWKRGLLNMRRIELEHSAVKKTSVWESGVRMLWAGLFGTKIMPSEAEKALHWITQHQSEIHLGMLLQIEQDYYKGKYSPNASLTLEAQLDMLAGVMDYENEEAINGNDDSDDRPDGIREDGGPETTGTAEPCPEAAENPFSAFL